LFNSVEYDCTEGNVQGWRIWIFDPRAEMLWISSHRCRAYGQEYVCPTGLYYKFLRKREIS